MGGSNSGRQGGKRCTDDLRALDVRSMQRAGLLESGKSSELNRTQNGRIIAGITISVDADRVVLNYRQSWRGGEWRSFSNTVMVEWTPCNYGGHRAWWCCPARGCGRRVALLYGGHGMYACRHCYDLAYRSQRQAAHDLAARHVNKIRDRLGWDRGVLNLTGGKPKGMHWKTFYRLVSEHTRHSERALAGIAQQLGAINRQLRSHWPHGMVTTA